MLRRLRRALVESYVGAIGLGYMLAEIVMHFANIFAAPLTGWASRRFYADLTPRGPTGFSPELGLPELTRFAVLLVIWCGLVRWLYWPRGSGGGQPLTDTVSSVNDR